MDQENKTTNPAFEGKPKDQGPPKFNVYDTATGKKLNSRPLEESELNSSKNLWESQGKSLDVRQLLHS